VCDLKGIGESSIFEFIRINPNIIAALFKRRHCPLSEFIFSRKQRRKPRGGDVTLNPPFFVGKKNFLSGSCEAPEIMRHEMKHCLL
jgi:hypothetical protein